MLKGMTFYRLPCSRFVNRCITLSAFIAYTWVGCWSVAGQDATQEQQADSKVVTASHAVPLKMFSAVTTAPWEVIGNQPGYVKIQVSRILNHPDFKLYGPMITPILDSALFSEPDAASKAKTSVEQFGLDLNEIDHIQGGAMVSFRYNPQLPEGQRSSLNLGMSKAEVTAANPVDWPGLIKALDFEKLREFIAADSPANGPADLDKIHEAWIKSAKKSRSYVIETNSLWMQQFNTQWDKPTATKKAIWEAVSGGVATVVYDIDRSEEVPVDFHAQDAVTQANHKMEVATKTAAWGVDFSQDYKTCHIRFAAAPKAGVSTDELLKHFESLRDAVEEDFRDALEQHPDDDDILVHPLQQLKKAKATIVNSKKSNGETTKAYLLVEGECSADLAPFLDTFSSE